MTLNIDTMIANANQAATQQTQSVNQAVTIDQSAVQTQTVQTQTVQAQTVQSDAVDAEEAELLRLLAAKQAAKQAAAQAAAQTVQSASPQAGQAVSQIQPHYLPAGTQQTVQAQQNVQVPAAAGAMGAVALPAHLAASLTAPIEMSMETFMSMGMSVDLWLKPSYAGLTVGDNASPVPYMDVIIDMTEKTGFQLIMAIRYGSDSNVKYDYTHDYLTNKDGRPWAEALAMAYQIDPRVSPFRAVQLPMVVADECKNYQNQIVATAGQTVGYTTAVTGWSAWQNFYQQCQRAGLLGNKVKARLTNEAKMKDANKWGLIKFELLGVAAAATPEQKTA